MGFWMLVCHGQQVIWNKVYPAPRIDEAHGIVKVDTNHYLICGLSSWAGKQLRTPNLTPSQNHSGASLTRINGKGDTLWNRNLGFYGGAYGMTLHTNGNLYIIIWQQRLRDYTFDDRQYLIKCDTAGHELARKEIIVNGGVRALNIGLFEAPNGDIVTYGYNTPSTLGTSQCDWLVGRFDQNLQQKWLQQYNPRHVFPCWCYASNDFNNRILVSGQKGQHIAVLPVDSNGITRDTAKVLYTSPDNAGIENVAVQRLADGGYLASGSMNYRTYAKYILGKYDDQYNPLWERYEDSAGLGAVIPTINQDGSIVIQYGSDRVGQNFLEKIDSNNATQWIVPLGIPNLTSINGYYSMAYNPDESAILVGLNWVRVPPPGTGPGTSYDYLFTKVAQMGRKFDPVALPNSTVAALSVTPYPNPTSGVLNFRGLNTPAQLSLVSVNGQSVGQWPVLPGQALDLGQLPMGVYFYRLMTAGQVVNGKVVVSQ